MLRYGGPASPLPLDIGLLLLATKHNNIRLLRILVASLDVGEAGNGRGALHHAMNRFDDALSTLNEVEAKMTEAKMTDLDLVPVLHARAEVLESSGKPLALVAAQFTRARDIRKRSGRAMDPAQPPQRTTP